MTRTFQSRAQRRASPRAAGSSRSARYISAAAAALLALHALLAWQVRAPGIATGADDAYYLLLARSLRAFGYHDIFQVDQPWHSSYPPGYPLLLALWGSLFGDSFDGFVLMGILAATSALVLLFLALRRLFSPSVALLCLLPLAVNPFLISTAGTLASEPPYLLFSLLALWALSRPDPSQRLLIVAGAAAIMAALTRSIGVTLLLALGIHWLLERRFKAAMLFASACAATVGLWLLWTMLAPEQYVGRSYIADATYAGSATQGRAPHSMLVVLAVRFAVNVPAYFGVALPQRLPLPAFPERLLDNVLATEVVVVGFVFGLLVFLRRWRAAALYLPAYLTLLLLWPWQLSRFLDPLLPIFLPIVLLGVGELARRMRAGLRRPVLVLLSLTMTVSGGVITARTILQESAACARGRALPPPGCLSPDQRSYFAALEYIAVRTPRDAVFLTAKMPPLYYYTGRRTISYQRVLSQPPEHFLDAVRQEGAQYLLLGSVHSVEPSWLAEWMQASCGALALEASFPPRTYLFRVADEEDPEEGDRACRAIAEYRQRNLGRDFIRDP